MVANHRTRLTVRDATAADVATLTLIKGAETEAVHRDRLRDAQTPGFRYVVLLVEHELVGFACVVYRRPAAWSDAHDEQHLPQMVDLQVQAAQRGQGYGSAFVRVIEQIVATAGYRELYVSVDPLHNPRAYALYMRLGYHPLQTTPYQKRWTFQDSAGTIHSGEDWIVDMVKQLSV